MFDFPDPFRPVIALNFGSKRPITVRCAYDLKPSTMISMIRMVREGTEKSVLNKTVYAKKMVLKTNSKIGNRKRVSALPCLFYRCKVRRRCEEKQRPQRSRHLHASYIIPPSRSSHPSSPPHPSRPLLSASSSRQLPPGGTHSFLH